MKKNITKLLMGTITEGEIIELRNWLDDPKNESILESHIKDYHDINLAALKNNVDAAYKKVAKHIERDKMHVKKLIPNWIKYAAAVVLLFGIGSFYQKAFFSSQEAVIVPKNEFITLELDNGSIQNIDVSKAKEIRDSQGNITGTQKHSQISYSKATHMEDLVFNTLNVPNGKQFELELSDGTSVHLNAGSSLRYPVSFLSEGPRKVFLSGEAFFDVAEDKSNTFIVKVDELDVIVLGTEFNISAYQEDANIDVVLVEGSVSIEGNDVLQDKNTKLLPGQKGSFDHVSKNIRVGQVNTSLYTSWIRGHLVFRDLTFDQILTKLERHYSIEIENTNSELGKEVFNASFDKVEIEKVLSFFNDIHEIEYYIKENKIIIE